ncbi:hypothetical protein D3C72_1831530 [compost metagenome]
MTGQALEFGATVSEKRLQHRDIIGDRLQVEHLLRSRNVGGIHRVLNRNQRIGPGHLLELGSSQPHLWGDILHPVFKFPAARG